MKRPMWMAAGVALGVGGTLWAERRVRKGVHQVVAKVSPEHVAAGARDSARQLGERMRAAVDAGREERARREEELWEEIEGRTTPDPRRAAARGRYSDSVQRSSRQRR